MNCASSLSIWQVDAFAAKVFEGNPAAVVSIEGSWPSDQVLQAIAAENNLSETAFARLDVNPVPLRWFTPTIEVPLCGHATLAVAAVMHVELGMVHNGSTVEFATASGPLHVRVDGDSYVLDLPGRPCVPSSMLVDRVQQALGTSMLELWESVDRYVCVLRDEVAVRNLRPDMTSIVGLSLPGLVVTARGETSDFVSRYFAPAKGVPEDPVTGTSHCTLAPFWGRRLGKTRLLAHQLSHRGGQIDCVVQGDRVLLTGQCRIYLQGFIDVSTARPPNI